MCVRNADDHCVLQFTLILAAGCVLHRRTSRVIHRQELFWQKVISHSGGYSVCRSPGMTAPVVLGAEYVQRPRREPRRCGDRSPLLARPPPPLGGGRDARVGPVVGPGAVRPRRPFSGPQPAPGPRGAFETEPRRPGAPDAVGRPAPRRRLRSPAWATPNYASRHHVWPSPRGGEGRGSLPFSLMILPQVHLRKPCYDFYFL